MGKPAARLTDMHTCPMATPGTPPIPHVGGPISGPGCPTVLIGGLPAAVMGDMCVCVGPPDTIVLGSTGVMIGGKPAARMGDQCVHGGAITIGCPTVLIGEVSPGSPPILSAAPLNAVASAAKAGPGSSSASGLQEPVEAAIKMSAPFATKASRMQALQNGAEDGAPYVHKHNENDCKVQYQVLSSTDEPVEGKQYEIRASDGNVFSGKTDSSGMTRQVSGYTEGMCKLSFID